MGSETRSPGSVIEKLVDILEVIFLLILMEIIQNVCLDELFM